MRTRGVALFAVVLAILGAACNGDDVALEAFNGTGEVVAVEPDARPAEEDPTGGEISGAVIVNESGITGLDDCAATDDGFRVFIDESTSFSPSGAEQDLERLRGEEVRISGRVTKRGDVCTPVADSISAQDADAPTSPGDGGASTGTAPPGADDDPDDDATAPPEVTTRPSPGPADEGSILDPEEARSPAPETP